MSITVLIFILLACFVGAKACLVPDNGPPLASPGDNDHISDDSDDPTPTFSQDPPLATDPDPEPEPEPERTEVPDEPYVPEFRPEFQATLQKGGGDNIAQMNAAMLRKIEELSAQVQALTPKQQQARDDMLAGIDPEDISPLDRAVIERQNKTIEAVERLEAIVSANNQQFAQARQYADQQTLYTRTENIVNNLIGQIPPLADDINSHVAEWVKNDVMSVCRDYSVTDNQLPGLVLNAAKRYAKAIARPKSSATAKVAAAIERKEQEAASTGLGKPPAPQASVDAAQRAALRNTKNPKRFRGIVSGLRKELGLS